MKNELIFTVIADTDEELQPLTDLLQEFELQSGVRVAVARAGWAEGWPKLFGIAVNGRGSDVAQIGSTWGSSLMGMRALRTFSAPELRSMGAPDAFFGPAWESTQFSGTKSVSVPWTTYTFVLCYRRDLLHQVGVNEQSAFVTGAAMSETLAHLQQTGIEFPTLPPSTFAEPDLVHLSASWVWDAGGDFVNPTGRQTLFNTAESRSGLASFLDLFRFLPAQSPAATTEDGLELFAQGRVGVMVIGADAVTELERWPGILPTVREQWGLAPLPGIPWIGGDNLVIWNHVYDPELQQACLSLVTFLTSQEAQVKYANTAPILPARQDALPLVSYPPALSAVLAQIMRTGRAHYAVPLWNRVENGLGSVLSQAIAEFRSNPTQDKDVLLVKHLRPLAENLDRILKG